MTTITLTLPDSVPATEIDTAFLQGMVDRMGMSYFKYGKVADAYPIHADVLSDISKRIGKYRTTGNTEWLMDVANFAMIEFAHPSRDDAHYAPTDSSESPGRAVTHGRPTDTNADLRSR